MERQREDDGREEDPNAKRARIDANIEAAKERLFSLARDGDLAELQTLVNSMNEENGERDELINSVDYRDGDTILHIAAENNDLPMIEWILSDSGGRAAGFDNILAKTNEGQTALHDAVQRRFFDAFLAIVEGCKVENGEGVELVNTVEERQETLLHVAAENNDLPTIKWILSDSGGRAAGFNRILATTRNGETALHVAVQWRHFDAFLAIVEGCKVENGERVAILNAVDDNGRTVLHLAAEAGSKDIMKWLLSEKGREAGFNPDNIFALDNNKESILYFAAASCSISAECLDLILAQCRNAEGRCRLLFGVDNRGRTVLHYAAHRGTLAFVEWVVTRQQEERGGSNEDLFALTNDKESTLHIAARRGVVEVFDFLLSRCNNTSERLRLFLGRDDKGWTIFHHTARWSTGDLISHILRNYPEESKMIIDARDNCGMTVLHRAIIGGINKDSRKEWSDWHSEEDKQAVVSSLLGLSYVEVEERGHREKDVAAMDKDEEDDDKKPIEVKKVVAIAAGGADPNVGLKFE